MLFSVAQCYRYVGPHEVCDICDGLNVSNPSMVINVLYVGAASCRNYYRYGFEGRIPNHLCDVIQHYGREPCGCVNETMLEEKMQVPYKVTVSLK